MKCRLGMRRLGRTIFGLALFAAMASVFAQEIRPLARGDYRKIVESHAGKPFVVALWSLDCAYCGAELAMLGDVLGKHRNLDLVLISTDANVPHEQLAAMLEKAGLGNADAWVFADSHTERLRFEIDAEWYGELPRTCFYAADGSATAVSGSLTRAEVEAWIGRQPIR